MFSLLFERMVPELIKVGCLWIEVLSYMNAREWIQKMTAYLKGEDFWTPIKNVVDEQAAQLSSKASESAAPAEAVMIVIPELKDSKIKRSVLKHDDLIGKWKDK